MAGSCCTDCASPLGRSLLSFWSRGEYACQGDGCDSRLCKTCHDKRPLFVVPAGHDSNDLQHAILEKYCKSCFQNKSTLNFDRTYDVVEGTSGTIFVFVHGGSGCRTMFQAHAAELQQRFGSSWRRFQGMWHYGQETP